MPYLAHRRAERWPDPTAFRPERFLDGAPEPYTGSRSAAASGAALGAAFATLELREVLRAVVAPVRRCVPDRPAGERMRRRGVTLAPARGGRVAAASVRRATA